VHNHGARAFAWFAVFMGVEHFDERLGTDVAVQMAAHCVGTEFGDAGTARALGDLVSVGEIGAHVHQLERVVAAPSSHHEVTGLARRLGDRHGGLGRGAGGVTVGAELVVFGELNAPLGAIGEESVATVPAGHALAAPGEGAVGLGVRVGGVRRPLVGHTPGGQGAARLALSSGFESNEATTAPHGVVVVAEIALGVAEAPELAGGATPVFVRVGHLGRGGGERGLAILALAAVLVAVGFAHEGGVLDRALLLVQTQISEAGFVAGLQALRAGALGAVLLPVTRAEVPTHSDL